LKTFERRAGLNPDRFHHRRRLPVDALRVQVSGKLQKMEAEAGKDS